MSDRENIEELRKMLNSGLEIVFSVYPQRMNPLIQIENQSLAYEKLNHIVQGMTELRGTVEELLMLVKE